MATDENDDTAQASGGSLWGKLGKGIKGAIFVPEDSDDDEPAAKPAPKAAPSAKGGAVGKAPPLPPRPALPGSAQVDPEYAAELEKETGIAAKPAYTAFASMDETLKAALSDETTRLKAAMAAILPQGHTPDKVIFDLDECLQVLDTHEAEVNQQSATALQKAESGLTQQATALAQQIEANNAEVARLQQVNANLEQQRQTALGSVNAERTKVLAVTANALATIQAARAKWSAIKNKVTAITPAGVQTRSK